MTENPSDDDTGNGSDEIHTEIKTDVDTVDDGTVYGILTVRQGDRRIDWKIGEVDGKFAEGYDCYHQGELFVWTELHRLDLIVRPGDLEDVPMVESGDADTTIFFDELIETQVYNEDGVDTAEWVEEYLDRVMDPEVLINERWENRKARHVKNSSSESI